MNTQVLHTAQQALQMYFGYQAFRPAQEGPVEALLSNEDVVAIMPTGAGKSICFQVPALVKKGITIVFSPLISLMKDQVDGLLVQNIPAALINSTLTNEEFGRTMYHVRRGDIKLLYIAPERLGSTFFRNVLRQIPIGQVIIDEAHCISEWGHDFRPSYRMIGEFLETLPHKPVVGAFTATATQAVENDIKQLLHLEEAKVFVTGFDRPNLSFHVVHGAKRMDYVLQYVKEHSEDTGIIYCATRKDVEKVYESLVKHGITAGYYHGGLPDDVRKTMQNKYAYDQLQVMVATNAFGMGIDKSNVRYVLHYQMPRNMESYYQEAGRAGRDGAPAECVLLYSGQDVRIHKYLIEQSIQDEHRQEVELRKLQAMIDYCFCSTCLRKNMMQYFGERPVWDHCDNCSSCEAQESMVDVTAEAKAIFRAIRSTDERFGRTMIVSIVRGERTERIVRGGYDALVVFGALSDRDDKEIKGWIRQFVASGYLRESTGKYPILSLTAAADEVLAGRSRVQELPQQVAPRKQQKTTRMPSGGLFEQLRQHRKALAVAANLAPYLIFPDTVLIDMASTKPKTLDEFHRIRGVGEAKLKKYGQSFLSVIEAYERTQGGKV